jgi:hypothetical protein
MRGGNQGARVGLKLAFGHGPVFSRHAFQGRQKQRRTQAKQRDGGGTF